MRPLLYEGLYSKDWAEEVSKNKREKSSRKTVKNTIR